MREGQLKKKWPLRRSSGLERIGPDLGSEAGGGSGGGGAEIVIVYELPAVGAPPLFREPKDTDSDLFERN